MESTEVRSLCIKSESDVRAAIDGEVNSAIYSRSIFLHYSNRQNQAYLEGRPEGFAEGWALGNDDGLLEGLYEGFEVGRLEGSDDGFTLGYDVGRAEG